MGWYNYLTFLHATSHFNCFFTLKCLLCVCVFCPQGGLSTSEEMCLAFLFYYPAMNLSACASFPNLTTLRSEMGTPSQK